MITEEEEQRIINKAVEKALLTLPEVVGNLIMSQANIMKLSKNMIKENPEFVNSKDIVSAIIERVESDNPGIGYEEIIKRSVPIIKEKLKSTNSLNVTTIEKPNRSLTSLGEL